MGKDLNGKELGEGLSQRKDGRYCARYTDRYGKRKYIYGHKLKEVKDGLNRALYENKLLLGEVSSANLTVDELYQLWYAWKETVVKGSTLHSYVCIYNSCIRPYIGVMYLKNINTLDIQRLFNEIHIKLKRSSVQDVKNVLSNMFDFAVKHNYMGKNPSRGTSIQLTAKDLNSTKKQKFLTKEQIDILFDYAEKHKHKHLLLYKLMLLTGLRVGEAIALLWSDVDFENKNLNITKTTARYYKDGKRIFVCNQTPKTKTSIRTVPLCNDAIEVLKMQQQTKYTGNEHIFLSTRLSPLMQSSIDVCFQNLLNGLKQKIEFPTVTPHVFRHTFATRCLECNVPPKVVQQILGHSNLSMTMDLYTHVPYEYMRDCVQKICL